MIGIDGTSPPPSTADVDLLDRVAAVSAAGGPLREAIESYRADPRLPAPADLGAPGV